MTTDSTTRTERVARLVHIGELEVSGEHPDEVDAYFAPPPCPPRLVSRLL